MDHNLRALLGHEVDRRLVDPVREEYGASKLQDLRGARSGEAGVAARCDDEVRIGAVSAEGVLGEVGDAAILEGLCGLQALLKRSMETEQGQNNPGLHLA